MLHHEFREFHQKESIKLIEERIAACSRFTNKDNFLKEKNNRKKKKKAC